jgi:hypothetical protein
MRCGKIGHRQIGGGADSGRFGFVFTCLYYG